jgi:hypothetical protein
MDMYLNFDFFICSMVLRKIKNAIGNDKYKYESKEDKWKKRSILATLAIVAVILVIAAFVLISGANNGDGTTHYVYGNEEEDVTLPASCDEVCILANAVKNKNATACELLTDEVLSQECFEKTAAYSLDSCLKVIDYSKKKECVIQNAISEKSADVCLNLATEADKNECLGQVDPCYFKKGSEKNLCLAIRDMNYSRCGTNQECLLKYADQTKDTAACGMISLEPDQYACAAIATDNDNECKKINYMNGEDACYKSVAIWTNRSGVCSLISDTTYDASNPYMRDCYAYFSVQENNLNYCNNLQFDDRWYCYTNYSVGTMNVSGCGLIDYWAKISKKICYYDYAMNNRDPGVCTQMEEPLSKINCYSASITANNTKPIPPENCEKVIQGVWRDKCYVVSAKGNNDLTICNYIDDTSIESNCLDYWKK